MMTGESLLVDKKVKSNVIGGTILSLGTLKMEATKVGKQTALAQIIQLVKEAPIEPALLFKNWQIK